MIDTLMMFKLHFHVHDPHKHFILMLSVNYKLKSENGLYM